jgi:hypothetical protein
MSYIDKAFLISMHVFCWAIVALDLARLALWLAARSR